MSNQTFNVTDFTSIYKLIDTNISLFNGLTNRIAETSDNLAKILHSEDSNISNSYMSVASAISNAGQKIVGLLSELKQEMVSYANATIENERETETKVKAINEELQRIATLFSNINSN